MGPLRVVEFDPEKLNDIDTAYDNIPDFPPEKFYWKDGKIFVVVKREDLEWLINYLSNLIDDHEGGDILKRIKEEYGID